MSPTHPAHDVLTLEEAADYLRVSGEVIARLADGGVIPSRRVGSEWRFLKIALNEWLKGRERTAPAPSVTHTAEPIVMRTESRTALLQQAGLFSGDRALDDIRAEAYRLRRRSEIDQRRLSK
jgi:excisionase family DNA binding protein